MGLIICLGIFSILIIAHEFGHFIAARQAGVKVEKFAIGFGPAVLTIKGKQTEFLICLFPLGGYVKMAGDSRNESQGRDDEFLSKPVGVKMRIVVAGPVFNYILAFVIFWIVAMIGFPYLDAVVGKVLDGYPAQSSGIKEDDRILEVNGEKVNNWSDMTGIIHKSKGTVSLKIKRADDILQIDVPLTKQEIANELGKKKTVSMIGIAAAQNIKVKKYNLFSGFKEAASFLAARTQLVLRMFGAIISGDIAFKDAATGPLGIYYLTSEVVKIEKITFRIIAILNFMAMINISLAIVNLFPFPVIDGGHLVIFLVEKIRNKPLSERVEETLMRIGIVALCTLFIFCYL